MITMKKSLPSDENLSGRTENARYKCHYYNINGSNNY